MYKYIIRRLLLFVSSLLGVSLAIFLLLRIIPGDVAAVLLAGPTGEADYTQADLIELRETLGLDKPIPVQYGIWMWNMTRGDFGDSFVEQRPVRDMVMERFPVTIELAAFTLIIIVGIAVPVGIIAALKQDTMTDYVLRGIAILGLAAPSFWIGLMVILFLSIVFGWLPPIGFYHLWDDPAKSFQQLIFPSLALGFAINGLLLRMTRAQLLEVLREDYIRTARAKGLREQAVVLRHALRNALIPVVTVGGFLVAGLLSGSVAIELIFNLPGMGRTLITAVNTRDFPVIEIFVLFVALLYLSINLLIDLSYAWLDPRIRYE